MAQFEKLFTAPPAEYSTAPFFVWNGDMNAADIDRMLADYKAQGIQSLFIHPRPGMITEYLSDRWFALVRYTVDRAKRSGMQVWLYDENSYPSGFAGGHVPAQMPESYNEGQGLIPRKLAAGESSAKCSVVVKHDGSDVCFEVASYEKRAWHGGFSYVDLLKPGVTEKFIEVTMPGYEKTLPADLTHSVPGIFTDEPNIAPPARGAMRWTPDLFEQFEKRWGYDLRPRLMSLFENTGDWQRTRHNYYSLLLDLFVERWSKPWFEYTERKGLKWTGHYWEHGWPSPAQGPDNMAMYAWHQVPGIDMLFNQFSEGVNAQFGNVRSVKELSSVANQLGRRRALSETYGGAGWELRFEDMKRLGDWEMVLGVNFMNQHLSHGTLIGARKYDYPQSFTYHTPWWTKYKSLAEYFTRVSLAMAAGEQVNRTLIIEPTTTAWMYASISKPDPRMMQTGEQFQSFLNRIEAAQAEYDLGSENIIRDRGKVAGAKFIVGNREYETVILPPGTENLDSPTVKLLAEFAASGGRVLASAAPAFIDGKPATSESFRWSNLEEAALANPAFTHVSGKLFHQRRQLRGGELLFFVNSSLEHPAGATVKSPAKHVREFDPLTGNTYAFPVTQDGTLRVELSPAGSLMLVASDAAVSAPARTTFVGGSQIQSSKPIEARRLSPNALRIDYCDLKLGGSVQKDIYFFNAQEAIFKHFGLAGNPWNTAVQYKTAIVDQNKTLPRGGFEATFYFDVDSGVDTSKLVAVVEQPRLWTVSVNGKPVQPQPNSWWLDVRFGTYDVGKFVDSGRNAITLEAKQMSVFHELEPVFVTGDFGLAAQEKGFKLVRATALGLGSWKSHNLPAYHDRVAYSATFALDGSRHAVQLGKWNGTVAEVLVNGSPAGLIYTQPYRLDITGLAKQGSNRIDVVVYGSLKNLLGPHHGKINRGLVSPWSFRTAPEHMPPGSSYDLEDYGLFEPFTVWSER